MEAMCRWTGEVNCGEGHVQVDAIKYDRSKATMAKRIYPVHSHVKYGYR